MKRTTLFTVSSAMLAFALVSGTMIACGDDDDDNGTSKVDGGGTDSSSNGDTSTGDSSTGDPKPPTLGAQIDRMGRPAVATALISTFEPNDATKGTAKDAYNKDANQAGWSAAYKAAMSGNLPVYDALDQNCGNQLLAKPDAGATNDQAYGTLAGVLADDRLWLNTAGTTATQYLAVEANAVGVTNTDRGGRTPAMDVVDVTYSAVANGDILTAPVTDGIVADPAKTGIAAFPYLAAP